jgi:NAD(P)-dependent dehydrogenase (short-subunit alcohol dehydrogenase family)
MQGYGRLDGRVAIITGSSRGIGLAIAKGYAREGARLVLTSRNAASLAGPSTDLKAAGAQVLPLQSDVSNPKDVDAMVQETLAAFGRIDVLVNNAGIQIRMPSEEFELESWRRVIDTNLTGVFLCSQAVGKVMLAQRSGSIITIASMSSYLGMPGRAPYSTAKTAVVGLTRTLAAEWGPRGVRVNAIAPGYIWTDMTEKAAQAGWLEKEVIIGRTPLRRFGQVEDLVGPAIFLASDEAAFLTGQVIPVDGGFLAYGYAKTVKE